MSDILKKIIGATVGTPIKPQAVVNKAGMKFKVEDGELKVTYDNEKTWTSLGEVQGEGGGGVQSNYLENDSNSPAYIKNRPFYEEGGVLPDEITKGGLNANSFMQDPDGFILPFSNRIIPRDELFADGAEYKVEFHVGASDQTEIITLKPEYISKEDDSGLVVNIRTDIAYYTLYFVYDYTRFSVDVYEAQFRAENNGIYYYDESNYRQFTLTRLFRESDNVIVTLPNKFLNLKNNTDFKELESIAKGANNAISYQSYEEMVVELNGLADNVLRVGQNIMIVTLNVPDLWISGISADREPYIPSENGYDEDIVNALSTNGSIQVGYYILSALETQKVNLPEYVKKIDYANSTTAGVVKTGYASNNTTKNYGIQVDGDGRAYVNVPWNTSGLDDDALGFLCTNGSVGLAYGVGDASVTCTGLGECTDLDIEVGSVVKGLPVRAIYDNAFRNCSSIISVTIPDSVTGIYENAFEDCTSLRSVNIPNGVSLISEAVFYNCSSLETITIPASVGTIDIEAFGHCKSLNNIIIGRGVQEICGSAFNDCTALENVFYLGTETEWNTITIADGNECLTNATIYFYSNTKPTGVGNFWHFVDGVPTVWVSEGLRYTLNDDGQSYSVSQLGTCNDTEIVIPSVYNGLPVTKISNNAFEGYPHIISVTIPNSVTEIGEDAFNGCSILTSVTIGNGVTTISKYAFAYCSNLTSVTIGNSVTRIGDHAFSDSRSIRDVYYLGTQAEWNALITSEGIQSSNEALTDATIYFYSNTKPTGAGNFWHYVDGIPTVWDSAGLEYTLNDDGQSYRVTDLGSCQDTDIVIASVYNGLPVTKIGDNAFIECSTITSVIIPNSVTDIGENAFSDCTTITSVTIPDSVIRIADSAFSACSALKNVFYAGTEAEWDAISIYAYNECLTNATIHFESEV